MRVTKAKGQCFHSGYAVVLLFLLLTGFACQSSVGPVPVRQPKPKPELSSWNQYQDHVGEEITVVGVAEDDKDSAHLICKDFGLAIPELSQWPSAEQGKVLRVKGFLSQRTQCIMPGSGLTRAPGPIGYYLSDVAWSNGD